MGNFIDLSGQTFKRLNVLKLDHIEKQAHWLCECECGNIVIVRGTQLRKGITNSCGCYQKERVGQTSAKNITNQKFGRLKAIRVAASQNNSKNRGLYWHCICDCGNEIIVNSHNLIRGHTKSCGCLKKEKAKEGKYKNNSKLRKLKKLEVYFKRNSKNRNGKTLEYNLTLDNIEKLAFSNCFYCNKEPSNTLYTTKNEEIKYSGIDRIDSSKGYTIDNVVSCCIYCNQAKMAMSQEDFLSWIEKVYNYSIKNKEK